MKVVITGASKGLGKALALAFHELPQADILLVSRSGSELAAISEALGRRVHYVEADLSEPFGVDKVVHWVNSHWGRVDILINNAGALVNKPFDRITREELDRVISVNYGAVFFLTQGLLPALKQGKGAHVVNIGSMGGVQGSSKFAGLSVYSSSKAAVAGLSECLAVDLQVFGISVNCLALGSVRTEMLSAAFPGYEGESSPEEMARLVRDWSVGAGRLVSGKVIPLAKVGV